MLKLFLRTTFPKNRGVRNTPPGSFVLNVVLLNSRRTGSDIFVQKFFLPFLWQILPFGNLCFSWHTIFCFVLIGQNKNTNWKKRKGFCFGVMNFIGKKVQFAELNPWSHDFQVPFRFFKNPFAEHSSLWFCCSRINKKQKNDKTEHSGKQVKIIFFFFKKTFFPEILIGNFGKFSFSFFPKEFGTEFIHFLFENSSHFHHVFKKTH